MPSTCGIDGQNGGVLVDITVNDLQWPVNRCTPDEEISDMPHGCVNVDWIISSELPSFIISSLSEST